MGKFADHKIKYRSLESLLSTVGNDWPNYDIEGLIDPSQVIKVIQKVNKQLGLKVTKTKEVMVDFDNFILNLPDDMEVLNFAVRCGTFAFTQAMPQGVQRENVTVDCSRGCKDVFLTPHGETYRIVQTVRPGVQISWHLAERVCIGHSQYQMKPRELTAVQLSDNFMRMSLKQGKLYLNYEGILEGEDGGLLVLDHPLVNDYYEYAIKERVMENLYFEGEDVAQKLGLLQQKLQVSKREAYNIVNMPEFLEIEEVNRLNREAMNKKYYSIFL